MKKFAVFINTDTIIDMKFVEMKIISECGDFAEITKDPKGINLVIYNERLSSVLDWENNMRRVQKVANFKTLIGDWVTMNHINRVTDYFSENNQSTVEWHFIDIDHRNMIDEIYFYLNQNSINYDIPK